MAKVKGIHLCPNCSGTLTPEGIRCYCDDVHPELLADLEDNDPFAPLDKDEDDDFGFFPYDEDEEIEALWRDVVFETESEA